MTQTEHETADGNSADGERRNERSAISFPYSSLEDAEAVARAVHHWGGNEVSQARLATTLNTTVKSSGFRTDAAAAKIFGFVDGRGTLSLTPLGYRLVDEATAAQARVDAFKQVPLFRAVLEEHEGKVLPGHSGLEAEMLRLGVSQKQQARARQLFLRSAQHAGFFDASPERLVEPLITPREEPPAGDAGNLGVVNYGDLSPQAVALVAALFSKEAADWPDSKIAELVRAARTVQSLFK
jgi:hypothetical protein